MTLTPEDIERQTFKERFKGYDMDEVDRFLDRVVEEVRALHEERDALRRRLEQRGPAQPEDDTESLLKRTLVTAQRTADELVAEARAEAERLRAEANAESTRERERTRTEAEAVLAAIDQLKRFRQDYRERLAGVISDQLRLLERTADLPSMPAEAERVAEEVQSSVLDAEPDDAAPIDPEWARDPAPDETAGWRLEGETDEPAEAAEDAPVGEG